MRAGSLPDFTRIGAPYEVPDRPELVLDTQSYRTREYVGLLLPRVV